MFQHVALTTFFKIQNQEILLAQNILSKILKFSNYLEDSKSNLRSDFAHHLKKIRYQIQKKEPIHCILPAFPAKSPNRMKTLSVLPDYGEVLALRRLNSICKEIQSFYQPGARISICSDGRVFNDLLEVSNQDVDEYSLYIQRIINEENLYYLSVFNLEDAFEDLHSYEVLRTTLVRTYAHSLEQVREDMFTNIHARFMFNGIHRFLFEDNLFLHPELSKNKVRELSKILTYSVIQRSNAWSRLLEERFPKSLRLSIHPQSQGSSKIGIRLLESDSQWRTPWHSVVMYDGRNFKLVPKHLAEKEGARLQVAEGRYAYFDTSREHSNV